MCWYGEQWRSGEKRVVHFDICDMICIMRQLSLIDVLQLYQLIGYIAGNSVEKLIAMKAMPVVFDFHEMQKRPTCGPWTTCWAPEG